MSNFSTVFVVDDDDAVRNALSMSLSVAGFSVKEHSSAKSFLNAYSDQPGCLIADVQMPNMNGLELQQELKENNIDIPIIFITGHGDVKMSVKALKAGAIDFIEKPFSKDQLMLRVREAFELDTKRRDHEKVHQEIVRRYESLTSREREVMQLLIKDRASLSNKEIAHRLGISRRTIEVHRSSITGKMLAGSRAELVELAKLCGQC